MSLRLMEAIVAERMGLEIVVFNHKVVGSMSSSYRDYLLRTRR